VTLLFRRQWLETHMTFLGIQCWSLHDSEFDDIFPRIMQVLSICSRLSSRPQIKILSVQYWSLRHSEYLGPNMRWLVNISIFRRWTSGLVCQYWLHIWNPHEKSNPMSMISLTCGKILFLAMSIFRHMTHGGVLLVILDIFGSFLFFRVVPLLLAVFIYSSGGCLQRWQMERSFQENYTVFS